ncbi:MAG: hypothetical protein LPK85_13340 [Gammaproteobacteria bacterium]|nr:hypothetical protein [Gammaproteobacteria bacterium]
MVELRASDAYLWRRRWRLVWVGTILAVLLFFLLRALEPLAEESERVAVRVVLNQVRAQVQIRAAELQLAGRADALRLAQDADPMAWMGVPPSNYAGLCDGRAANLQGIWCFEVDAHTSTAPLRGVLVYRPHNPDAFALEPPLRWRVVVEYEDRNLDGTPNAGDRMDGLVLRREGAAEP